MLLYSCLTFSQDFPGNNGKLQVVGHRLCNERGNPVILKGVSMFGHSYFPECITYEGFKVLRHEWNCNVIRTTVFISEKYDKLCYNNNPNYNKAWIDSIVEWCGLLDMYCIIDWHVLNPGNPNDKEYYGAEDFWNSISLKYKNKKYLLYEICNEPHGNDVTWDTVAEFANKIIKIIRKNDPNTIIIIGTPNWSQKLEQVDPAKIENTKNVMYSFHFYAATHSFLYDEFIKQIHRIPVFVTEWGVSEASGDGKTDYAMGDKYLDAMEMHVQGTDTVYISSCIFSYADKNESSALLKPGSCNNRQWNNTTPAGDYLKKRLLQKAR